MSAERLRAAAALLRERAEAATPGPWVDSLHGDIMPKAHPGIVASCVRASWITDAAYIATMSPTVALALADWLAKYADLIEAARDTKRPAFGDMSHALAVADAILGGSDA